MKKSTIVEKTLRIEKILMKHAMPPDKNFNNSLGCPYILMEERITAELIEELLNNFK